MIVSNWTHSHCHHPPAPARSDLGCYPPPSPSPPPLCDLRCAPAVFPTAGFTRVGAGVVGRAVASFTAAIVVVVVVLVAGVRPCWSSKAKTALKIAPDDNFWVDCPRLPALYISRLEPEPSSSTAEFAWSASRPPARFGLQGCVDW